jgi:cytidylate kinase
MCFSLVSLVQRNHSMSAPIPVIAIDGPSASGKGTVAARVAEALGFAYLDSGALYRVTAYAAGLRDVPLDDEAALARMAQGLNLRFDGGEVFLDDAPVGDAIRTEEAGRAASKIAALPALRAALLDLQRGFRKAPGLVTDGRDMGSVVFPDASVKVFLTASAEERAQRRYKQLIERILCRPLRREHFETGNASGRGHHRRSGAHRRQLRGGQRRPQVREPIPVEEFKNDQGELEVQVGDFVSVAIESIENGYGDTILSRDKRQAPGLLAGLESAWNRGAVRHRH